MSEERKLTISGRSTLGSGKIVGAGQIRQNFSHGRSKTVVVERKRRRVLKKGDTAEVETPVEAPAEKPLFTPPKQAEETHLTSVERDSRAEALKDAILHAEDERMRASEQQRQRQEDAALKREEEEARSGEERRAAAEDDARHRAEEDAKRRAEEEESRLKIEEEAAEAEQKAQLAEKDETAKKPKAAHADDTRKGKGRGEDKRKTAGRPTRRGEKRRRSGKLTVGMALEGGEDQRQRSLAALRRAQAKQKRAADPSATVAKKSREVIIPESITVHELANRMAERAVSLFRVLKDMDVDVAIGDTLDQDTAELVVAEFGHKVKRVSESDVEIGMIGEEDKASDLKPRPPVVTVMGHVDHGKTSLLDALRSSNVVSGEAGGITQHIGAYQVETADGHKITFIDTPGHAAFTEMRARGASITDIVVLVVAADDGIMPQTIEAINHAKAADVPIIVAINKMDVAGADPARVRQDLLQHEVIVEEMSGDVLDVEVSALKKTGLDKLLEAIYLQSELLELKANPDRAAEGVTIEARLDKNRGPVATALIKRGTLRVGDLVVAGPAWGRVKALMDEHGEAVTEAGPGQPVEVLGLNCAPGAGDDFAAVENEARAREITEYRLAQIQKLRSGTGPVSLESAFAAMKAAKVKEFPIVLKGDVQGSIEAINAALLKIGNEEVQARIIHSAVGGITESDITLARASSAPVIGFNVRANVQARAAAKAEDVAIQYYSVIYNLIDDVKAAMSGMLDPAFDETILGLVDVKDVFSAGKIGKAAGCIVVDGSARMPAKARLLRDSVVVYEGEISSLRRFKDDVAEVKAGTECGITLENYIDIKAGDQIEVYELHERQRTL
ncbi:MAG: translation initiation factor IF-2 [Proteobacteria bacterium]|nr:translation initiation factor IF-2 [Pseudomonadota bacterium]